MAIDTTDSYQEFTADGQTAYFSFNFNYVDSSEIIVGKRTGDNIYEIVQPEYYQVKKRASENGGQVRFISNPSGSEIVDNPPASGDIIRIERRSQETSNATWQVGLEMSELIALFDKLFRLVQENIGRFDNTIETFATQHGVKLYELLSEHTDKLFYWDNDTKTIVPTDFPRQDVVRSVGGLFFRIKVDESTNTPYLEWSKNGVDNWYMINIGAVASQAQEALEKSEQAIETANNALAKGTELDQNKADKTALAQEITDRGNAESELSGRITTNAEEIGTIKNDLDDLGDQVHGIEEKIPAKASTINQLATMDDIQQSGGLSEVVHDDTMTGTGRAGSPLSVQTDDFVKKSATEMQTISGPLSVTDEICLVDGADGAAKHSLSIVAGIPTETATDMDIIGNRKFDTLPTTDDITAYADLNPKSMITKGQVASAISTKADTTTVNSELATKATKATDFMTAVTESNKGATKTEIDALESKTASLENNKQDKATAINYDNITGCFPEIPQDIKLELAGGVLTLKAGSKVYVPNGAGVFDTVTTQSDLTITINETSLYFVFVKQDGSGTYTGAPSTCFSGATQPSIGVQYAYWYDTTNNVIKFTSNTGSTWTALNCSLPIAIVTAANGTINSIDQIFNGFGCIGSTSFALPGVEALIPNGRNADGTLNNIKVVLDAVETFTDSYAIDGTLFLAIKQDKHIGNYFFSELEYRKGENLYYYKGNKPNNQMAVFAIYTAKNGGKIETFTIKTAFRAVDYNDTEYIGHQAMPSAIYDDLTLGASGSVYTAPADGYFVLRGIANTASAYIVISNENTKMATNPVGINASSGIMSFLPAKKGDVVSISYGNFTKTYFRFVYTVGSAE